MSLNTKRRKLLSQQLLSLFEERKSQYDSILKEKDDSILDYDEGDDVIQRDFLEETVKTFDNALKELPYLGNYVLNITNENYLYLQYGSVNIGKKIFDNKDLYRNDLIYFWNIFPNYISNNKVRELNLFEENALYTNLDFNCIIKGEGYNVPIVSTINLTNTYLSQPNEDTNTRNLKRVYNAFISLYNKYISNGNFTSYGIDFTNTNWAPYNNGITYIPTITLNSYNKLTSNSMNVSRIGTPYSGTIANSLPSNEYYVCSNEDLSEIKIAKLYTFSEVFHNETTAGEFPITTYFWDYQITGMRNLSTTSSSNPLVINRYIDFTNVHLIFEEIKNIYLYELNNYKNYIDSITTFYTLENDMRANTNNFISFLTSLDTSNISSVLEFYARANAFDALITNRINTINNLLINQNYNNDLKELITLRINKIDGTLFSLFQRIEGMDTTYNKYLNGAKRTNFIKNKILTSKVLVNPNNDYMITIDYDLNEVYSNVNYNIGDYIYIIDDNKPEILVQIKNITTSYMEDDMSNKGTNDNYNTSTKKVKILTVNRIISKDFSIDNNLRIVKELV